MRHSSWTIMGLCLAGTALAGLSAAPARAAIHSMTYTSADVSAPAAASQAVQFDVFLPLRNLDKLHALLGQQQQRGSAQYHKWLTPAQFGAQFGPDRATMSALAGELAGQGFAVKLQTRSLHLTGTAAMVERAFGAKLSMVRGDDKQLHTVALGGMKLSPMLAAAGAHVLAFSPGKPIMHTSASLIAGSVPDNRYGETGGYWYDDFREAYAYPAINTSVTGYDGTTKTLNGSGATIAALMSSDMLDHDIFLMFKHEHYAKHSTGPIPTLAGRRYVAGAIPGVLTDAFAEASLDTQQEIGGAPGANVLLYDIPDLSDGSIAAGYLTIDELNEADVVSSSFGGCEKYYTAAYSGVFFDTPDELFTLNLYDTLFLQGNAQGITFLASSGDEAGRLCVPPQYFLGASGTVWSQGASSPAADPNVTGVGGTNLVTTYSATSKTSRYKTENAYADPRVPIDPYGAGAIVNNFWWGAGGGASVVYSEPAYQTTVYTDSPMRVSPDIGMQVGGCPTGSKIPCDGGNLAVNGNGNRQRSYALTYIQGGLYGLIGTSVSSPEFAGALAYMVELHGRQGNLNTYLYANWGNPSLYHVGIPGYNAIHPNTFPSPFYNQTVGLGTPYVSALVQAPAGTPLAGTPQTPTNY